MSIESFDKLVVLVWPRIT